MAAADVGVPTCGLGLLSLSLVSGVAGLRPRLVLVSN